MAKADVNLDGYINVLDLAHVAATSDYLTSYTSTFDRRAEKDQNGDGNVDILDLAVTADTSWYLVDVPPC